MNETEINKLFNKMVNKFQKGGFINCLRAGGTVSTCKCGKKISIGAEGMKADNSMTKRDAMKSRKQALAKNRRPELQEVVSEVNIPGLVPSEQISFFTEAFPKSFAQARSLGLPNFNWRNKGVFSTKVSNEQPSLPAYTNLPAAKIVETRSTIRPRSRSLGRTGSSIRDEYIRRGVLAE